MDFTIAARAKGDFDAVITRVVAALKDEGFGVLTEIDVAKTFKEKLGREYRPYRILGACNPMLAHEALAIEDRLGVMLPCNVVVQQKDDGVEIAAIDPMASIGRIGSKALEAPAREVKARLERVVAAAARG